jgi:hypothetical protein
VNYCYDGADRLLSTTRAGYGSLAYDDRGNTTTIDGETLGYDSSDRHISAASGDTTVTYVRDATDRIVQRSVNGSVVARYGYSGSGDAPDFATDSIGQWIERNIGLPGGLAITRTNGAAETWSYPDVHGDVVATSGATGPRSATLRYGPFGETSTLPDNTRTGSCPLSRWGLGRTPRH